LIGSWAKNTARLAVLSREKEENMQEFSEEIKNPNTRKRSEILADLNQIESRLNDLEAQTEAVISRLVKQRSEIQAADKRLAILSSRHSNLCSLLSRIEEGIQVLRHTDERH